MDSRIAIRIGRWMFTPQKDISAYEVSQVLAMFLKVLLQAMSFDEVSEVLQETGLYVHFTELGEDVEQAHEEETTE